MSKCKSFVKRRKQNHKISFHFFAGSPHTPRRKWIGKEIFGFGSRPKGARGAHCSLHHRVRAYDLGSSHHALRACEVSRFATGKKFGFHHIDGAIQNKSSNRGRLRRQAWENPRGFSTGFATKPEARDPAKAGSTFSEHSAHSCSEPIFFLSLRKSCSNNF